MRQQQAHKCGDEPPNQHPLGKLLAEIGGPSEQHQDGDHQQPARQHPSAVLPQQGFAPGSVQVDVIEDLRRNEEREHGENHVVPGEQLAMDVDGGKQGDYDHAGIEQRSGERHQRQVVSRRVARARPKGARAARTGRSAGRNVVARQRWGLVQRLRMNLQILRTALHAKFLCRVKGARQGGPKGAVELAAPSLGCSFRLSVAGRLARGRVRLSLRIISRERCRG